MRVGPQRVRLHLVIFGAEVHDWREVLADPELPQHVDAVTILALPAAEQDQVVAGARKFRGQVPGRGGVVRGDDRIRPVRRDVVHEQGAELRLLVDDHDLDAHR